ncbi:MAG: hypothetical protein ACLFTI_02520 [Anaerolineales bacterium]
MNIFNRIVVVLTFLILIVLVTATAVIPHIILVDVGGWLGDWGNYFGRLQPGWRLAGGIAGALIFDIIALLILYLELRPKRKSYIRVQQVRGGMATIETDSIIQQLKYKLDPLPGVLEVDPRVNAKRDKVQATVDVEVSAGVNVPERAGELMSVVQSVLADDLGLQVHGKPEVRIKVAKPTGKLPVTRPEPQPRPEPEKQPAEFESTPDWVGPSSEEEKKDEQAA